MNFFDAHTHLNQSDLYINRQHHLQNFINAGGIGLVNIGVDHTYNTRGIEIASQAQQLFPHTIVKTTIWLHPYEVAIGNITTENMDEKLNQLYELYKPSNKDHIIAIGEIGIDIFHPNTEHTLQLQKEIFWLQCQWARTLGLPIVIHSRANRQATHEVLQDFTDLTIYFHCRPYWPDEIRTTKETYPNFYIGFCGNISYPKAENIRKSLRYLIYNNEDYPDHVISGKLKDISSDNLPSPVNEAEQNKERGWGWGRLLIETDAPYLAPQSHRGQQNTPTLVKENYTYISSLLWHDISEQVIENSKQCYNLWK